MAPKIGGNREIPAYFFCFVLLKLLSISCGVAELSAGVMICLIALLLKNKKACLLIIVQTSLLDNRYDSLNINGIYTHASLQISSCMLDIHSISKVYTP